jgi:hypothetical protein
MRTDGQTDRQTDRQTGRQTGRYDEANSRFSQLCQYPFVHHKSNTERAEIELWANMVEGWRLTDWRTAGSCSCSDCGLLFFGTSKDRSEKLTKTGYKCAVLRLIYSLGPLNIGSNDKLHNYINELPNSLGNSVEKRPSWETNNHPTKTLHLTGDYSSPPCSKNACTSNMNLVHRLFEYLEHRGTKLLRILDTYLPNDTATYLETL